jgi:hypothetical protein
MSLLWICNFYVMKAAEEISQQVVVIANDLTKLVIRINGESDDDYHRKIQFAQKSLESKNTSHVTKEYINTGFAIQDINTEFAIQELGFPSYSHRDRLDRWLEIKKSYENSNFSHEAFKKYRVYVQLALALDSKDCDKIDIFVLCLQHYQSVMTSFDIVGICEFLKSEERLLQKVNADFIQRAINELRIENPAFTQAALLLKSVIEQWRGKLLLKSLIETINK